MKKALYLSLLFIFILSGTVLASDISLQNLSVPTLMYHKISDDPKDWNEYCISSHQLRSDFEEFKQAGFTPIGISDYLALSNAYKEASMAPDDANKTSTFNTLFEKYPNPLLITIDDGYDDGYTIIFPLLREYNFKANFALVGCYTKAEEPSSYLIHSEIREMSESGYAEFGNHTNLLHEKSFDDLKNIYNNSENYNLIKEDYSANGLLLTEILGKPPTYFSYPYGISSNITENILNELNITVSLVTNTSPDFVKLSDSPRYISRYNRIPNITSKELVKIIIEKIQSQNPKVYAKSNLALKDYYTANYTSATLSELINTNKIPTNKFLNPTTNLQNTVTPLFPYNNRLYY